MESSSPPSPLSDPSSDLSLDISSPLPLARQGFSHGMTAIAFTLAVLAMLPLFSVLIEIVRQGVKRLNPSVFVSLPAPLGMEGVVDGFGNAIVGTLVMVGIASVVSIPVGVLTAIFMVEFGQRKGIVGMVRFVVTVLSGVPSIVVGVFAYGVIVLTTRSFSAIAGSFALAVIMLPIVVLATEEALKLVPMPQRLASAALGSDRVQTTFRVVLATALPGITTGVLLAIARAAGETAPLIFTALFSDNWLTTLGDPAPSLSVLIYNYATSAYIEQNEMAWTASLVLVSLVLLINVLSRLVTRRRLTSR